LNKVVVEDIPYFDEALEQIKSLGEEEMPDAAGISEFNYHQVGLPSDAEFTFAEAFVKAAPAETARAEATPAETTPIVNPKWNNV
jgi:hypothetical protein